MGPATYAIDSWFPQSGVPRTGTLLFCLPYAGGSATAFHGWDDCLPPDIHCLPVHLPGRGTRFAESPAIDVLELSQAIVHRAAGQPFAIFGHSMGARLAFEVARQLRRDGAPLPIALFVGGSRPPHMDTPLSRIAHLPDEEFCGRVVAMGGTPAGLLDNAEVRTLLLPALRADFAMVEAYRFRREPPLPIPIIAFAGSDDPEADPCDMTGWSAHTTAMARLRTFAGNHFFLHSEQSAVVANVAREVASVVREIAAPAHSTPADDVELADLVDIATDEVVVVEVRLDGLIEPSIAFDELSLGERQRAAATVDPVETSRFITRYALLRRLLCAAGVNVGTAELPRGPGGKPAIAHRSGLRFNVSHSGDRMVVALSRGREIGIAIERSILREDTDAMATRWLSDDERQMIAYLPDDEAWSTILRIHTAKMAILKAVGDCGSANLAELDFGVTPSRPWRAEPTDGGVALAPWRVYHLDLSGAVGAVAIGAADWRLSYHLIRGGGV